MFNLQTNTNVHQEKEKIVIAILKGNESANWSSLLGAASCSLRRSSYSKIFCSTPESKFSWNCSTLFIPWDNSFLKYLASILAFCKCDKSSTSCSAFCEANSSLSFSELNRKNRQKEMYYSRNLWASSLAKIAFEWIPNIQKNVKCANWNINITPRKSFGKRWSLGSDKHMHAYGRLPFCDVSSFRKGRTYKKNFFTSDKCHKS